MFRPEDISQITKRGSQFEVVQQQIEKFKSGFSFLKLTEAASNYHGIITLSTSEIQKYISVYDDQVSKGLEVVNFVPASGAASRMFKSLYAAMEYLQQGKPLDEVIRDPEVGLFLKQLDRFAFYNDLRSMIAEDTSLSGEIQLQQILEVLLLEKGMNYGNSPKGLLKFHCYPEGSRTPLEEQLVEGAMYSKNRVNVVQIHFTVSPEHQQAFEKHVDEIKHHYEQIYQVSFSITFSQQNPSTDMLAVNPDNVPFRNNDGSLLFRPAGHGALLVNMNELKADLIFIKNIDNVVPDQLKVSTVEYKKAIAGVLLSIQEQVFNYQKILNDNQPGSLESGFYAEAANYLENVLHITPPTNQVLIGKEEMFSYCRNKFNRPLRVCGMVKNHGEPGGGPFFARNSDGSVSLQIAENSQIDFNDPEQRAIAGNATHFNPVDLVCGVRNYRGEKYDLLKYSDPDTGFISSKSKDGKELKAQELPGLWNGSMADWNTIFVQVPLETFNPVKTVTDLLRKEHQTK